MDLPILMKLLHIRLPFVFRLCLILLFCGLSGCATFHTENSPSLKAPLRDPKTVEIVWMKLPRGGFYKDLVLVQKVGDMELNIGTQDGDCFVVSPGLQKVSIAYLGYRGATPGFAGTEVEVDLQPGHRYYATGVRDGEFVNIWMVDAMTGEPVSPVVRQQFVWHGYYMY